MYMCICGTAFAQIYFDVYLKVFTPDSFSFIF